MNSKEDFSQWLLIGGPHHGASLEVADQKSITMSGAGMAIWEYKMVTYVYQSTAYRLGCIDPFNIDDVEVQKLLKERQRRIETVQPNRAAM